LRELRIRGPSGICEGARGLPDSFIWHLKLACHVGSWESVVTYLYGLLRSNLDWSVATRVRAATDDGSELIVQPWAVPTGPDLFLLVLIFCSVINSRRLRERGGGEGGREKRSAFKAMKPRLSECPTMATFFLVNDV